MPADALSAADLAAMIARDDAAGDGLSRPDDLVYTDRHRLIEEVQRLREAVTRLQSGRPTSITLSAAVPPMGNASAAS